MTKAVEIPQNQLLYSYQIPMFAVTVSTVVIVEGGVILIENGDDYKFPGGFVKAGFETIQFAAVRHVKEQTGLMLQKGSLIPVDFRSDPDRSETGNEIDIGMVCIPDNLHSNLLHLKDGAIWVEVDFENKCIMQKRPLYMDHDILIERAIDIVFMIKE